MILALLSCEDYVFFNCESLKEVTLPECLKSIGYSAFADCESLRIITLKSLNPPKLDTEAFSDIHPEAVFRVPLTALPLYKKAPKWRKLRLVGY